jgi:hypothetical protein
MADAANAATPRAQRLSDAVALQTPSCRYAARDLRRLVDLNELCVRDIEFDEVHEKLPPDVIKFKWRKEQILAQQRTSQLIAESRSEFKFHQLFRFRRMENFEEDCDHDQCPSTNQNVEASTPDRLIACEDEADDNSIIFGFSSNCSHAVWSGWLKLKDCGFSAIFRQWRPCWCVLSVEGQQVLLASMIWGNRTSSMQPVKSVVLDPSSRASFERPVLYCCSLARLSIKVRGSGRRIRLTCENPEEAERLLLCMNLLLESTGSTAPP